MSYWTQSGDAFNSTASKENLLERLPVGNYVVSKSMFGLYLTRTPDFTLPERLYGDFETKASRILATFQDRPRATGALFAGEKGSGKSQLARLISVMGYEMGMPTILVNAAWAGDEFAGLLADIEQPAIVLMDEFEKVYNSHEQEEVLTLLDGSMTSKKLFILTVNNKYAVDSHMRNRPGRLFYLLDFSGLDSEFVREYCEDNLDNKEHLDNVVKISTMFEKFNFDILKALVEEMNRFKEDAFDAMTMLNARPMDFESSSAQYVVRITDKDGVSAIDEDSGQELEVGETPMQSRNHLHQFYVSFKTLKPKRKRGKRTGNEELDERLDEIMREHVETVMVLIRAQDVVKVDAEKGVFEFETQQGFHVTYTRKPTKNYTDLREMMY